MWALLFNFLCSRCVRAIAIAACLLATGCQVPQWRVGQAKVPKPVEKTKAHVEAERRAAFFIAEKSTEEPVKAVAEALSESLGVPEDQTFSEDVWEAANKLINKLRDYLVEFRNAFVELNSKLEKFEGKKIEGTGFNMFGLSMSLPVIGFILLAVFCPSSLGVMWWLLKKSRGALTAMIKGVQDFKDSQPVPEVVQELHTSLSKQMDASHKKLVRKIKSTQI